VRPLRAEDPVAVGGYRLLGTLGAGGMGRVYLARSQGGRTVAVKVIRPEYADEPAFRSRFRREVDAARRVGGRWTAALLDADAGSERPYLVTAYIPGPSLGRAVADRGPLPGPTVRALGAGLAEALIAVHDAGLVHRDLKPSNVLLSLDGPRVIDFGISRAIDASVLTTSGAVVGSPAFMSPEQVHGGEIGPASDVFSLGSVLVFAAAGAGPFDGQAVASVLHNVLTREPDLDAMPVNLRDLTRACLHKDPAERPTPRAVLSALAPDGAAALMTAAWLPADLVANLSRQAVALLDLDTPSDPGLGSTPLPPMGTPAPGGPPTPGGTSAPIRTPVPGNTAPLRNTAPPRNTAPRGNTGPPSGSVPPAGYASPYDYPPPTYGAPGSGPPASPVPGAGFGPPAAGVHPGLVAASAPPHHPGSLPAPPGTPGAARPGPPGNRPPRGALIAVAAAGVLGLAIIVVLAVLLAMHAHRSSGSDGTDLDARTSEPGLSPAVTDPSRPSSTPEAPSSPAAAGTLRPGPLPAGYVGTWQGDVTTEDGFVVAHEVITLRAGDTGQTVGHAVQTVSKVFGLPGDSIQCVGDLRLVGFGGAAGDEVVVVDIPGTGNNATVLGQNACSEGDTTRLRLGADGRMTYSSDDDAAGRPTGTLTRQQ
jgi:serine/threonine protein kinase